MDTYKILRFFRDQSPAEVIDTGLTLAQVMNHCNDPLTHGDGWFDGWTKEEGDD